MRTHTASVSTYWQQSLET